VDIDHSSYMMRGSWTKILRLPIVSQTLKPYSVETVMGGVTIMRGKYVS
jgi:hypothetical protein